MDSLAVEVETIEPIFRNQLRSTEVLRNEIDMSDFPGQMNYESNFTPPTAPRRPTSVTVLAIIGIILGGLGALCSPFGLIFYFVQVGPPNPVIEATRADPAWFGYTIGSTALGWVISVILLAGSIGSLMLKEWARKAMLAYAWVAIVMTPISFLVNLFWLGPKMKAAMVNQPGAALGQAIGMFAPFIALILPICILYFLTRPHVKAAFAEADANLV